MGNCSCCVTKEQQLYSEINSNLMTLKEMKKIFHKIRMNCITNKDWIKYGDLTRMQPISMNFDYCINIATQVTTYKINSIYSTHLFWINPIVNIEYLLHTKSNDESLIELTFSNNTYNLMIILANGHRCRQCKELVCSCTATEI